MVTRSVLRYIRITPRKFRQIIPLIKGKRPEEALAMLASIKKGASVYAEELLKSAIAGAKRMQGVEVSNLYISKLVANGGPTLKRFRAASMGRASTIRKRTSHITLELDEIKVAKELPKSKGPAKPEVKQHKDDKSVKAKETKAPKAPKAKEEHKHGHAKKHHHKE